MTLLEIIFATFFLLFLIPLGYQFILGVLALFAPIQTNFETAKKRKFAIIIPAHNEAKIISKTIYSLSALIYPKQLYDVFVVADNCTDDTAKLARDLGVNVLERTHETKKGKGYALRWVFDQILESEEAYDALIVIDADSLVSGNYLEVMNYYLERGSRVIQSGDLVLPEPGNWSVEATQIGFLLYNYVKPLGRKVLNFNMGLRGNGMCFRTEVLQENPWEAWSLTEDVEYGLILILNGIHIDFAPEANVYAQMPVEAANAESQRSRWEIGRYQVIRSYAGKFLSQSFKKGSLAYLDVFLDLIIPPFVNMMFMISAVFVLVLMLWTFALLPLVHLLLWGALIAMGIIYLFLGLYVSGAKKELYQALFRIPFYLFWKLKVYLKFYRKGTDKEWVKTKRDTIE